jgi:hypothetical protein
LYSAGQKYRPWRNRLAVFKQIHCPAALRLPGLRDSPPSRPVQAQPPDKTVASLLCRAATAPCPAYDPWPVVNLFTAVAEIYRQVEDT